ncbi:cysteine hydrolase family protein [Ochrobactrum sp. BTU1]|uniref:cysteine hydrolase family protein n=1 Tax=Ochrobactrum sp. BTU1 TaxID=2840456 RepID=UPI001C0519BE|nr:cysteine hydrolase [Ochrobactrum sp. BTU1]
MARDADIIRDNLRFGSVHLCVDMQNLFGAGSPWNVPWSEAILPKIVSICEVCAEKTVFTRFIPPKNPGIAIGAWKKYYEKWESVTLDKIDSRLVELADPLQRFVGRARVLDKSVYSPWTEGHLQRSLYKLRIRTLVVTGAETDLCVLATVLGAVDRGYRVILVKDAVCSSSDKTHDAALSLYHNRLSEQITLISTDELLDAW